MLDDLLLRPQIHPTGDWGEARHPSKTKISPPLGLVTRQQVRCRNLGGTPWIRYRRAAADCTGGRYS